MLAALFLLGASMAAGGMVGFDMDGGDDEAGSFDGQSDHVEMEAHAEEGARGAAPGLETLVSEVSPVALQVSDAPGLPDVPAVTTLVSEAMEVETMSGEAAGEWLDVDAGEEASGLWGADETVTEGALDPPENALDLGAAENPEAETILDADGGNADGDIHDWKASDDPVVIEGFDPEEDLLQVTLFTPPGSDGVDVELGTSVDGQDGEIRADDRLVAIVKGHPDLDPETLIFDLQDSPGAGSGAAAEGPGAEAGGADGGGGETSVPGDATSDENAHGETAQARAQAASGGDGPDQDRDAGSDDEDHPGRGHARGHDTHDDRHDDKRGKGRGRAERDDDHPGRGHAYGHDNHDDHPGRGHAHGHENHDHGRGTGNGKGRG